MIFGKTPIEGAFRVGIEPAADDRGWFARSWCRREFEQAGIPMPVVQCSLSATRRAGTLRGMHFQWPPSREGKLIRCQRGRIHDVLLDLRPGSPTFLRSVSEVLDAARQNAFYCPPGVAHGFQSLTDDAEVHYMMSDEYRPELYGGVRYDDPAFGIDWPLPVHAIHPRDAGYPDFDRAAHAARFGAALGGPLRP